MRFRIFALLIMGVVLAVLTGFATFSYTRGIEGRLASSEAALGAFGDTVNVPIPRADIARGMPVGKADFDLLTVPARHLPSNLLQTLPVTAAGQQLLALSDLKAGALITQHQLGLAEGPGFDFALSPDGRAVAVAPRNLEDFREFLKPGVQLDLFWTRSIGGGSTETRLLAQGLQLAHGPFQPRIGGRDRPTQGESLILEAGIADAARLLEAAQSGHFHILPSGRLRLTDPQLAEISVGPSDLSALPLAVRRVEAVAAGGGVCAGDVARGRPALSHSRGAWRAAFCC